MMHMMITEDHFKKYWELFKIKYSNYKEYLNYFEKTYISSESNKWHYFDVLPNVFLTNNICESLNVTIKRDWTNRERKPFHIFLNILKEALIDLAKEGKIYKFKVEIKSEMKFLVTQLEAKKLFVKKKDYYFLDKEEKKRIEINQINQYFDLKYTDVDSFQADQLSMVILRLDPSTKKATCFYKFGFTNGMCHHKLALEMNIGSLAKTVVLLPNKVRGRKRKAESAFHKQEEQILPPNPTKPVSQLTMLPKEPFGKKVHIKLS